MNFEKAIHKASIKLKKNNIKSHLLDSEILMSNVLNKDREFVILNLDKDLKENNYHHYQKLVDQRSRGKPIAYLIGKKSFWKYEFDINENVLIPRPDTELIIENILKIYKVFNNR